MLRKGFLKLISDWTSQSLEKHPRDFNAAVETFDMDSLSEEERSMEYIGDLFSEWVVFDYHFRAFTGMTALEYFCSHNPLNLPESEMTAYRELLNFEVGYFEVVAVTPVQSVRLRDMRGVEYEVTDISASMNLHGGETVWARIASITGIYHIVSSRVLQYNFTYSPAMKKSVAKLSKEDVDARSVAHMMYGRHKTNTKSIDEYESLSEKEAARRFDKALADAGMQEMLSSATIKKWVNDEKKFPLGFSMKAVFFLLPEDLRDEQRDTITSTLQTYLSNLPRKALKGKTPHQASMEHKPGEAHIEIDTYSYADYADDVHEANNLMPRDPQKAYLAYERLMQRLLDERVPMITAFRIFCNAGLCLLAKNDPKSESLGFELIHASLRLNPLYDFGRKQKERCVDPLYDLSSVPKKERATLKTYMTIVER